MYKLKMLCQCHEDSSIDIHQTVEPKIKKKPWKQQKKSDTLHTGEQN